MKSTVLKGLTGTNLLEPIATGNSITAILQYFTHTGTVASKIMAKSLVNEVL